MKSCAPRDGCCPDVCSEVILSMVVHYRPFLARKKKILRPEGSVGKDLHVFGGVYMPTYWGPPDPSGTVHLM